MQGHTGPFIQYTHARIKALLRKAEAVKLPDFLPDGQVSNLEPSERDVIALLNSYPAKLEEAAKTFSPAIIASYAFELAKEYNQFYQAIPVLSETDPTKLKFRIAFTEVVGSVLKKAMGVLGIDVPERMWTIYQKDNL